MLPPKLGKRQIHCKVKFYTNMSQCLAVIQHYFRKQDMPWVWPTDGVRTQWSTGDAHTQSTWERGPCPPGPQPPPLACAAPLLEPGDWSRPGPRPKRRVCHPSAGSKCPAGDRPPPLSLGTSSTTPVKRGMARRCVRQCWDLKHSCFSIRKTLACLSSSLGIFPICNLVQYLSSSAACVLWGLCQLPPLKNILHRKKPMNQWERHKLQWQIGLMSKVYNGLFFFFFLPSCCKKLKAGSHLNTVFTSWNCQLPVFH